MMCPSNSHICRKSNSRQRLKFEITLQAIKLSSIKEFYFISVAINLRSKLLPCDLFSGPGLKNNKVLSGDKTDLTS